MDATAISLYVDLEKDAKADIETIARSALAFSRAIRETAYIIDPSLEIRIELISGTESSLSLNSVIKSLKSKDIISKKNLIAVASAALLWFSHETRVWSFQKVLDFLISHDDTSHLSPDDLDAIARKVTEALDKRVASQHVERIYRELDNDPAVRGVGATAKPGHRPSSIVPRSEFAFRSSSPHLIEEHIEVTKRVRTSIETVTLISPVLKEGPRRWKFSGREGEFGAKIKDHEFLEDLLNGRTAVPMVMGIQMEIELHTSEEK